MNIKKYKIGMYGGKFMPMHKGHKYCLDVASSQCEKVYAILFYGGSDEDKILSQNKEKYLSVEARKKQLRKLVKEYDNVICAFIDVSKCRYSDGSEDWDAETPLVREVVGDELNAVYGSEISYTDYFRRAYPESEYVLVDPPRIKYPISATKIRNFKKKEEIKKWII